MTSVAFAKNQAALNYHPTNQQSSLVKSSDLMKHQQQWLNTHDSRLYSPETIYALSKIIPNINANSLGVHGSSGSQGSRSGIIPTNTYGKNMYISLDVHGGSQDNPQQVINAVRKFPNINFTLYFYERDKEKIPDFLEKLPDVGIGLHIDPSEKPESVERFYEFIKENNIQSLRLTPASIHGAGSGRLKPEVMKKLEEYDVPFIRTAESEKIVAGKLRNVIPATFKDYKNFKEDSLIKNFNHYFTHANELNGTKQNEILNFFNLGVGK